ncbi:class I SAM-dependent DNA methyltransferase [Phaeobacter gallaeciensis]|uniref:class I SAM-dependent DNA methyltransferase n=1 Tax=Phaeobacter gallaeciensis TaxID=60890 RepID=UPI000BBC012E|nr:class I SAM-dependent methyltransferase [Phaeobacter gallaeciensis]ATF16885.1 putative methyltransferase [Phaeobacter gallaeciensis]ATF20994.1 putative methyltransferase [Phaeobacter gallaeciensis]
MSDRKTLDVYAKAAQAYADGFARADDSFHDPDYAAFTSLLPACAHILDLGCGPGHWAARFKAQGFVVSAMDASPEMAALAKSDFGIDVEVAAFEALEHKRSYDGIWANFSLLHAPRRELPEHLKRIHRALNPGGIFHIGMKLGDGEGRDKLGRFYAYYSEDELKNLLQNAGFTVTRTRRGNGQGLAGGIETYVILTAHA